MFLISKSEAKIPGTEAVVRKCSVRKVFLKISQNSQESACVRVPFSIKLQALTQACNFIKKETLAQVFFYEFCEIFKNIFFHRTPLVDASTGNVLPVLPLIRE